MEEMRSNGRTGTHSVPQPEKPLDSPMFGFIFFKKNTYSKGARTLISTSTPTKHLQKLNSNKIGKITIDALL